MLAAPTTAAKLPAGWAAEPKWDGFRALLAREPGLQPRLISRRGTDLSPSFPEIIAAAAALPTVLGEVIFDGELVIWNAGRLDFRLLLRRHGSTARSVRELAAAHPAHSIAFDVLQLADRDLTREPYRVRRGMLEAVFAEHTFGPLFTLCPSSTDPDEIDLWLTAWTEIGIEGLCFKRLICGLFRSVRCPAAI
jgi:ATP-dependent DNA ligase